VKINKRTISNFATYLMGIAIGIMLVGLILQTKQRVFKQHEAKQQAQAMTRASETTPATGE